MAGSNKSTEDRKNIITVEKEKINEVIKESVDDLKKFLETEIGNRLTIYSAQGFLGQFIQDLQGKINQLELFYGTEIEQSKK
jgi:hypothetical protein